MIRVVDQGRGVLPADRERIFEPFQRRAAGEAPGAGLGLAIARGFTEANGGRLTVESRRVRARPSCSRSPGAGRRPAANRRPPGEAAPVGSRR